MTGDLVKPRCSLQSDTLVNDLASGITTSKLALSVILYFFFHVSNAGFGETTFYLSWSQPIILHLNV